MEFVPIDPKNKSVEELLSEIAKGVNATHTCVHAGQRAQAERDRFADEKRQELAETVGHLVTRQDIMEGSIKKLAQMFGAVPVGDGDDPPPKPPKALTWKDHLKVGATVLGALSGGVLLYQLLWPTVLALHAAILQATP